MIKHIVLLKLKAEFSDKEKKEILDSLKLNLLELKNKISEIVFFEVGVDILNTSNSYDLGINSEFKSLDDLEKYRIHPEHQKVVELIKINCIAK